MQIVNVYACVRALADAASSLPLVAYRRTQDGRETLSGRVADLLGRPAPTLTQADLVSTIVAQLNLHGNAYIGKYRNEEGVVDQLGCLPPDRVEPELKGGLVLFTYVDDSGHSATYTEADIVPIRALSTDGLVGLSPIRQCREVLGLDTRLVEHGARYFQNAANPSGLFVVPEGPAAQDNIDNLRSAWESRHKGAENAHRIGLVRGDVRFEAVSISPEDSQFLEQRKLGATEIARIFRVPPWIIGAEDGGSLTYANVTEQMRAFLTFSVRPWLTRIEQALSADRDLFASKQWCEFTDDAVLKADAKTRAEVYEKALDPVTGWLDRDEVRALENLKPQGREIAPRAEEEADA